MTTNPFRIMEQLTTSQLCEKLRSLSNQRSPAPKPDGVVVVHEWVLLQEAARRMEILAASIDEYRRTAANTPDDWPHWAVCDANGKVVRTTEHGKAAASASRDVLSEQGEMGRAWTVRPLYVGGVTRPALMKDGEDDE